MASSKDQNPFLPESRSFQPAKACEGSGVKILVVDDDEFVRDLLKQVLVKLQYQVLLASNGVDGLSLFQLHRKEVVLVISDIRMPGMDGTELTHKIKDISPDLPVLLISGFVGNATLPELNDETNVSFVQKPFDIRELASQITHKVEEALKRKV